MQGEGVTDTATMAMAIALFAPHTVYTNFSRPILIRPRIYRTYGGFLNVKDGAVEVFCSWSTQKAPLPETPPSSHTTFGQSPIGPSPMRLILSSDVGAI